MQEQEALRPHYMAAIREEVKRRAEHGATVQDISGWLDSNGFSESERDVGRLLAKTAVFRARRERIAAHLRRLEEEKQAEKQEAA